MKGDEAEKKIVNELIRNSRQSFRELAKKTRMSAVTVMNRVRDMEKSGKIKRYTALVDYDRFGYDFMTIIFVKLLRGKFHQVAEKIASNPSVSAVYDITGDTDCIVIARFKSRKGMDDFIKKVQGYDFVERTTTSLVLGCVKEESMEI